MILLCQTLMVAMKHQRPLASGVGQRVCQAGIISCFQGKKSLICIFGAILSSLIFLFSFFLVHYQFFVFPSKIAVFAIALSAITLVTFTLLTWALSIIGGSASICRGCGYIHNINFEEGGIVIIILWPIALYSYLARKIKHDAEFVEPEDHKARHYNIDKCAEEGKFFYEDIPEAYRKKKACLYAAIAYLFISMAGLWLASPFVLTKACIFLVSASISAFIVFIFLLWLAPRSAKKMVICQKCGYITRIE
jgi:hypothetical protein